MWALNSSLDSATNLLCSLIFVYYLSTHLFIKKDSSRSLRPLSGNMYVFIPTAVMSLSISMWKIKFLPRIGCPHSHFLSSVADFFSPFSLFQSAQTYHGLDSFNNKYLLQFWRLGRARLMPADSSSSEGLPPDPLYALIWWKRPGSSLGFLLYWH